MGSTSNKESRLYLIFTTVNPEIFARILFSQIALIDIFATFKIRD